MEGISEKLGAVHAQLLRPSLRFGGVALADPKTEHCHTTMVLRMTRGNGVRVHPQQSRDPKFPVKGLAW